LALAAASSAGGLNAQVIRGRLITAYEDEPIERGRVELISADGSTLAFALTDAQGRFTLRAPAAGQYRLRGTAALHEAITKGPFEVRERQTTEIEFRLSRQEFELDTVHVSVARGIPRLASVGFYDRAREGNGHFIGQEEIDRRNARLTSDLLRGLPGVYVESGREPGPPKVRLRRRASFQGGTSCVPAVYIDGFLQSNETGTAVNDIRPDLIAGLELYTTQLRVPSAYAHGLSGCGVILIWTRR
jgi:hypothetical protein